MRKAGSAAYRARKAFEATKECNSSSIKTATTKITINNYGEPKTVKIFKKGIVLLGIITKADAHVDVSKFIINYDFYDITGDKHVAVIQGKQQYKIITDENNVQDTHTNLKPCSISVNLMGKGGKPSNKPSKPVELEIIIQYIELV